MEIKYRRTGRITVFLYGDDAPVRHGHNQRSPASPAYPDPVAQRGYAIPHWDKPAGETTGVSRSRLPAGPPRA